MTLYETLRKVAAGAPEKTAVVFYGKRIKYGELLELVERCASGFLAKGIGKGDVVTVCLPNSPSAAIVIYALNKIGAISNLVHPFISPSALDKSAEKTESKLIIVYDLYAGKHNYTRQNLLVSCSDTFMPLLPKLYYKISNRKDLHFHGERFEKLLKYPIDLSAHTLLPDEPAVFLPSGGSTGNPKIIVHSSAALCALCENAQFFLSRNIREYTAMYSVLPVFHGFGLCMNLHMCVTMGFTNVMTMKIDVSRMTKDIKKEKVNVLTGVPAMYLKLLNNREFCSADLSSLYDCFVGGDSASAQLISDFNTVLKNCGSTAQLFEGYGLTEIVTVCTVQTVRYPKQGTIGYPIPGTKVSIVNENLEELPVGEIGEICLSSPLLMLGYFKEEEQPFFFRDTEKWLLTGDIGYVDKEGYVYFKQRKKNILKVNGVNVFPSEVEEVASEVDGVCRVAAVGKDNPATGQLVKLFVQIDDGVNEDMVKDEILRLCRKKLIKYAVPAEIIFTELPLNAVGKVDRKKLL